SVTGILLGWKKNSDTLQPPTQEGASADMRDWQSWDAVQEVALSALGAHPDSPAVLQVERYDARQTHGIVILLLSVVTRTVQHELLHVLFTEWSLEVKVDPTSLRAMSVARRHSDWIETVHDLSIINDLVKLIGMNVLGFGLVLLTVSGLWLWYGPRWVRRRKGAG